MVSYSKHLYATVLKACTSAVDSLGFEDIREFEQEWIKIVQAPAVRVRWSNEVLELLGDGVVNACITAQICASIKGSPSMLSMLKSVLSSNILFATITKRMMNELAFPVEKLKAFLNIAERDTIPTKSFADAFETVIGALFRDRGFLVVQSWISALFKSLIVSATKEYHSFRSGLSDQPRPSTRSSKKRKRGGDDELKLHKRPKFMVKLPPIPVIVDAGSGSKAPLIQDLASVLENTLEHAYTRHRDKFLRDIIQGVSQASRRYLSLRRKAKESIDQRLFHHGKKYIRMMLAINDREGDYPDTDQEHGSEEHNVPSTSTIAKVQVEESRPTLDFQDNCHTAGEPIKLPSQFELDLGCSIREIELIDLVDDSDESDDETPVVYEISSTEDEETDTGDIMFLSRKARGKAVKGRPTYTEVISLLSSSEDDEVEVEGDDGGGVQSSAEEVVNNDRAARRTGIHTVKVAQQRERAKKSDLQGPDNSRHRRRIPAKISRSRLSLVLHCSDGSREDDDSPGAGSEEESLLPYIPAMAMGKYRDRDGDRDSDEEGCMSDDEDQ